MSKENNQEFAKLFTFPDGKQVLVTKEIEGSQFVLRSRFQDGPETVVSDSVFIDEGIMQGCFDDLNYDKALELRLRLILRASKTPTL